MALQRRVCTITSGGTISAGDGPGWGVTRTAAGTYTVTFPSEVLAPLAQLCLIITPNQGDTTAPLWARFSSNTSTSTVVGIYNNSGSALDSGFTIEICADMA